MYVATRCFSRDNPTHKLLQPGFLLALVECEYLKRHGCLLWDLGGVDRCPIMQYKLELTGAEITYFFLLQSRLICLMVDSLCTLVYMITAGEPLERPVAHQLLRESSRQGVAQSTSAAPGEGGVSGGPGPLDHLRSGTVLVEKITADDLIK